MGFRFHRSLRLVPGLRLNLSKSGVSLSAGGKGLSWNIGRRGSKATVGLPGSGLSYSSQISSKNPGKASLGRKLFTAAIIAAIIIVAFLKANS